MSKPDGNCCVGQRQWSPMRLISKYQIQPGGRSMHVFFMLIDMLIDAMSIRRPMSSTTAETSNDYQVQAAPSSHQSQ